MHNHLISTAKRCSQNQWLQRFQGRSQVACVDSRPSPRQTIADQDQGRLQQTKADYSRPKHSDIRGGTSISDAFFFICKYIQRYRFLLINRLHVFIQFDPFKAQKLEYSYLGHGLRKISLFLLKSRSLPFTSSFPKHRYSSCMNLASKGHFLI